MDEMYKDSKENNKTKENKMIKAKAAEKAYDNRGHQIEENQFFYYNLFRKYIPDNIRDNMITNIYPSIIPLRDTDTEFNLVYEDVLNKRVIHIYILDYVLIYRILESYKDSMGEEAGELNRPVATGVVMLNTMVNEPLIKLTKHLDDFSFAYELSKRKATK